MWSLAGGAAKPGDHVGEVGAQVHGVDGVDHELAFDGAGFREDLPPGVGNGDRDASAVGPAALAGDMAMGLKPAERLAHCLGLDAGQRGDLVLRDAAARFQDVQRYQPGMREPQNG